MNRIIIAALALVLALPINVVAEEIINRKLAISMFEQTDLALRYLRTRQMPAGSWNDSVSATALALRAFLRSYRRYEEADGPFITRPVAYLLEHTHANGAIFNHGEDPVTSTALAILALKATKNSRYDAVIASAQTYLKSSQLDKQARTESPDDSVRFASKQRTDVATLFLVIHALHETGLDSSDPFWSDAQRFLTRAQSRNKEDRGGFFTHAKPASPTTEISAALTSAGLAGLLLSGADNKDPRVAAARSWISANFALDTLSTDAPTNTLFNPLYAFARAMRAYGAISLEDASGKRRNWRNELVTQIMKGYNEDGSWQDTAANGRSTPDSLIATAWSLNSLNLVIHSLR